MKTYPSRTGDGNKLNVEESLRERGSWLTVRAEYQLRQQAGLPVSKQHAVLLYYITAIQQCGLVTCCPAPMKRRHHAPRAHHPASFAVAGGVGTSLATALAPVLRGHERQNVRTA